MSHRFDQLDWAVHRMHFPPVYLHRTGSPTVGTITLGLLPGCHFANPARLNHAAQLLANFVGRDFDLVVVRRPRALLDRLNLAGNVRCLLENSGEFFFEHCLFRVHAILLGN